jgi:hypothetical protein
LSPRRDGDGNHVHNEILLALPRAERDAVLPKLEFVRLNLHHVLHTRGNVTIHDRAKLEEAACDSYGLLQRRVKDWESQDA